MGAAGSLPAAPPGLKKPRSCMDPSIFIPVNFADSEPHIFISNVSKVSKYFPKSQ